MNTHTATINPGTYNSAIGTTTLKALCNDAEGFAIYAIGYTNNEDGNNTLSSTTLSTPTTINTGTALSGNSQWAMKLSTDQTATYPITIQNSFDSFHTVPDDYTLVAKRLSNTDTGAMATGSTLTTTYQAYISSTQAADTYVGKVKYVMVHPNDGDAPVKPNQIAVSFDGNGSTFAGGATKNRMVYETICPTTIYVGTTPTISKTPNVNNDGTANSGYQYDYTQVDPITIPGASSLKIDIDFGIEEEFDFLYVFEGIFSGEITPNMEAGQIATLSGGDDAFTPGSSTTLFVDGDTVTFAFYGDDYQDNGYYGYYAKVYPIFDTEQPGTEAIPICDINTTPVSGTYQATSNGVSAWAIKNNNEYILFRTEEELLEYLSENSGALRGTTIKVLAPFIMQQVSEWGDSINHEQEVFAIDVRDNKVYYVTKLADGHLWMTQNLDFDIDSATTYTSLDTDLPTGSTWTPSLSTYSSEVTTWGTDGLPESYDPGDVYWVDGSNMPNTGAFDGHLHLGNYYSWRAAIATNDSNISYENVTLINQSICPAGWTLPRAGTGDDSFAALKSYYASLLDYPIYSTHVGYWDGQLNYYDSQTMYWSSVGINENSALATLVLKNGNIFGFNDYGSHFSYGNSIRCLSRPVTNDVDIK